MERQYQAVLDVEVGVTVVDVRERFGVSRPVERWTSRYRFGGLEALADRSRRPRSSPRQMGAEVESPRPSRATTSRTSSTFTGPRRRLVPKQFTNGSKG
jgi:transposase